MKLPTSAHAKQLYGIKNDAATAAAAAVTIAADSENYWVLDSVHVSYSGTTTTGGLTVAIGGVTVFDADTVANGVYEYLFPKGLYVGTKNQAMVVTAVAGGASSDAKLNFTYR